MQIGLAQHEAGRTNDGVVRTEEAVCQMNRKESGADAEGIATCYR